MQDGDEAELRREHQDEILIVALAAGRSDEEAAALADCSAQTVRRRREEPAFARQVSIRRADQVAALTGRLLTHSHRAVEAIAAALDDDDPRIRLQAARLLLSTADRLRRSTEVDDQIAEVHALAQAIARPDSDDHTDPTGGSS
jgi:hypothetical protein